MRRHLRRHLSPLIIKEDVTNGLLDAAIVSLGFTCSLGFHPVIPVVAFLDGLVGRHLSKLRSRIALSGGDGVKSNTAALLTHTAFGTLKMGAILNPVAGFGIPLRMIAAGSFSHSLSKGTVRLAFDKAFADAPERRRARAVAYGSLANFAQSLLLGLMYKGSGTATALQVAFATTGAAIVLAPAARRKLQELRSRKDVVLRRVSLDSLRESLVLHRVPLDQAARPYADESFSLVEAPRLA